MDRAEAGTPIPSRQRVIRFWLGTVGLVLILAFVQRSTNNMVQTISPLLARYVLHGSAQIVGLVGTLFAGSTIAATYLINARIPRAAIERAVLAGTVALLLSFPLYALVGALWQLLLLVIIDGLATGVIFPFLLTLASMYSSGAGRERALALYSLTLSFSLMAGPLIQGTTLALTGNNLRAVYLVFTGVMAIAVLTIVGMEHVRRRKAVDVQGGRHQALDEPLPVRLAQLARNPSYRLGFVGNLAYVVPFVSLVVFGGVFAHDVYGATYGQIQLIFAAFFGTSFLARLAVVLLAPIDRKYETFVVSIILTVLGLVLLGRSHSLVVFVLAFVLLGIPHGVIYPLSTALIAGSVDGHELAFANSVFSSAINVVGVGLPPLIGLMVGHIGYDTTFFWLTLPVVGLGGVLVLSRPSRSAPSTQRSEGGPG